MSHNFDLYNRNTNYWETLEVDTIALTIDSQTMTNAHGRYKN